MGVWWSHLDPAIAGGIVGALIGGAFTVLGGFGGAWLIGGLESRREEREALRDHGAAVRAVLYELTTTMAGLGTVLDHQVWAQIDTPDWAYRSVHLALIARLPEAVAQRVAYAYTQVHILRFHLDSSVGGALNWQALALLEQSIAAGFESLRDYAEARLHIDVRGPAKSRAAVRRAEDSQGAVEQ